MYFVILFVVQWLRVQCYKQHASAGDVSPKTETLCIHRSSTWLEFDFLWYIAYDMLTMREYAKPFLVVSDLSDHTDLPLFTPEFFVFFEDTKLSVGPLLLASSHKPQKVTTPTMTSSSSCDIPSINLQPFFEDTGVVIGEDPTTEQLQVAATIHQACQEHGFVHVTHFGVSKEYGERLFAASQDLFDCDGNGKKLLVPWHPSHNTGYSPYKTERLNVNRPSDLKEAFNVRFPPHFKNESLPNTPPSFQEIANDDFFRILQTAAVRYGMACALALGLPMDFFSKTLQKMDQCTVRFLHYPPCDFSSEAATTNTNETLTPPAIRVGEHTDFGAYTFLLLKEGPLGLQVKAVEGGEIGGSAGGEDDDGWKDVVVVPSSLNDRPSSSCGAIINTGAMMARWTNDHWKATAHRVVVPTAEIAALHRYSIAFFVDPDADEIIAVDPKFVAAADGKQQNCFCYEPITSRDFLTMKLNEMTLKQ